MGKEGGGREGWSWRVLNGGEKKKEISPPTPNPRKSVMYFPLFLILFKNISKIKEIDIYKYQKTPLSFFQNIS